MIKRLVRKSGRAVGRWLDGPEKGVELQPGLGVEEAVCAKGLQQASELYKSHSLNRIVESHLIPLPATVIFAGLLFRKSAESPVVFKMYSAGYAIALLLAAVNVGLLWLRPPKVSIAGLLSLIVLTGAAVFLCDFLTGLELINIGPSHMAGVLAAALLVRMRFFQRVAGRVRDRWRIFAHHLALMAGFTVIAIIAAEVLLQLFVVQRLTPKTEREFLSLMSTRWPKPVSLAKPPGTIRIVGVADSMGVVGGASENYYVLERELRRQVSPEVQMVNVSVTGYEPRHELNILRFGMRYSPDVVIHSFFVGNDFTLYGEDTFEIRSVRINNEPGRSRLRPHNFFLTELFVNELAYRRDLHRSLREKSAGVVDEVGYLSKASFMGMQASRMQFFRRSTIDDMEKVFPILDSIHKTVRDGNAQYIIVINPDQTQVDTDLRQELLANYHLEEEDYDFDLPQKMLASYCAERRIRCVDLLPAFRAEGDNGDLYTVRDGHYSSRGNRVAAATIGRFLVSKRILRNSERSVSSLSPE